MVIRHIALIAQISVQKQKNEYSFLAFSLLVSIGPISFTCLQRPYTLQCLYRTILRLNSHDMQKCSLGHPQFSDVQSVESCKMPHSCNSIHKQYQL